MHERSGKVTDSRGAACNGCEDNFRQICKKEKEKVAHLPISVVSFAGKDQVQYR